MPDENASSLDIFGLMTEESPKQEENPEEEKKKRRQELLGTARVKDLFPKGTLSINKYTCIGVQCKQCVKVCPTNALYWSSGEVGIIEDLCVHCGACVLNCMVDNCMKIERKREDGSVEQFSKAKDVVAVNEKLNAKKRMGRVKAVFPSAERYCDRYADNSKEVLSRF